MEKDEKEERRRGQSRKEEESGASSSGKNSLANLRIPEDIVSLPHPNYT